MSDQVILLFLAGLRRRDLDAMPHLRALLAPGDEAVLAPSFPCLAGPVEANLLTGVTPDRHGVVGDWQFNRRSRAISRRSDQRSGGYPRFERPPIWDLLRRHDSKLVSEIVTAEGCGADSRFEWLDDIPCAAQGRPDFLYLVLPELAEVAQRSGPDSPALHRALAEVDDSLGELIEILDHLYGAPQPLWLVTGGYAVSPVERVCYPNRILHQAGLLVLQDNNSCPIADYKRSAAFAVVNRQLSHVYVADSDRAIIAEVKKLFDSPPEIAEILLPDERRRYDMDHENAGDLILISTPDSWQAYPWWSRDEEAPPWACDVEVVYKFGADPLELFASDDQVPLDFSLVKGSHGAPARDESQRSVIFSSEPGVLASGLLADTDLCDLVLRQFGI